jgi:hypothetical protein
MKTFFIPEPFLFNPLKHYLPYIREYVSDHSFKFAESDFRELNRELKHLGTCVMDIYSGELSRKQVFTEIMKFLEANRLTGKETFRKWTGTETDNFRIITLSDSSRWTVKYQNHETRYVHIFPARSSPYSFRIRANTLKSAIMYIILIGKDYVSENDLNEARAIAGLSPVKEVAEAEAVIEMIEILRNP